MSSTEANNNGIIKSFITTLHRFVVTLSETFPECEKTKDKVKLFELAVLNSEPMQKMVIEKWHESFKPLYTFADKRDMKGIIDSKFWLLEEIDFSSKWNDTGLTEEDRDNIWKYIDFLNGNARVYSAVPTKLQATLEKTAESLGDINLQTLNNLNLNDMLLMTQKMVSNLSEDDMKDLTSNMGSIMEGLGGFDGILQFGQKSGLFNALFPSSSSESSDESSSSSSSSGVNVNPLINLLNGTLGSALQSVASPSSTSATSGSTEAGTSGGASAGDNTPLIPGMPAELETMFANIGNSLINAANSANADSSSNASANPLESILKSLQLNTQGGAEEKKETQ